MTEENNDGSLTVGIPQAIVNGEVKQGYVQVKSVSTNNGKTMLVIHDGVHSIKVPLPNQHSSFLTQGLKANSILTITNYNCTTMSGQKTAILTQLELMQADCDDLGGVNAKPIDQAANSSFGGNNNNQAAMFGGPAQKNNAPRNNSGGNKVEKGCTPISALSPYVSSWKLKVRCTEKDEKIKEWSNARGTGKLFSFVIMDHEGSEIRCTAFNDEAEKFFNTVFKDKVYYVSKGRVKVNTFKTRVKNDYQITCTRDTKITLCNDDSGFSERQYQFVTIPAIEQVEEKEFIDVIAIVKECSELREFTSKTGKDLKNRKLILIDQSSATIEATLWNDAASEWTEETLPVGTVVILPGCRVGSFGGRSLSINNLLMEGNPPEKVNLLNWWKQGGCDAETTSLTVRGSGKSTETMSWMDAMAAKKGTNPDNKDDYKGCYFGVRGFVTRYLANFEKPPYYLACPESANSFAKVESDGNGGYFCAKTSQTYDSYKARYVLRLALTDWSDGVIVSTFNDAAELLVGTPASEVEKLVTQSDEDGFTDVFKQKLWVQGNFTIRAKEDFYEDQSRIRYDVISVAEVNYVKECENRINQLKAL